jgi:hypothetical protein
MRMKHIQMDRQVRGHKSRQPRGPSVPVVPLRPSPAVCLTRLYYKFQREFVVQTEPLHAVEDLLSMGQR